VFDGVAIYNALRSHKATVAVQVDGIAASIASVIAMAGDSVTMGRGTRMMIHNPSGLVLGQAKDMRETADLLDELAKDIAGFYSARAGGSVDQWLASMDAETWYSAQEAVDAGLADSVLGADDTPKDSAKTFDLTAYGYRYADRDQAPAPGAVARSIRSAQIRARHEARRQEARGK
jgi:ATP-dependent protease ClpP protease subunit